MYGVYSFTVLWGVVNNAGVNLRSDVELTSMKYFERLNDVNYLGMVRVTKQFLPLIRKAKGKRNALRGRLISPPDLFQQYWH